MLRPPQFCCCLLLYRADFLFDAIARAMFSADFGAPRCFALRLWESAWSKSSTSQAGTGTRERTTGGQSSGQWRRQRPTEREIIGSSLTTAICVEWPVMTGSVFLFTYRVRVFSLPRIFPCRTWEYLQQATWVHQVKVSQSEQVWRVRSIKVVAARGRAGQPSCTSFESWFARNLDWGPGRGNALDVWGPTVLSCECFVLEVFLRLRHHVR